MVADSVVFISHKQSGTILDVREAASAMIADELRYMKTRLKKKPSHMKQSYSAIPSYCLETEDIDLVNQTRYLGLIIIGNLKWDSQIKSIKIKISRGLRFLK